jgi:uncharacterized SAM-binding protein YcdF (DUF218 family)
VILRVLVRLGALVVLVYVLGYAFFVVSLPQPAGDGRTDAVVVLTGGAGRIERGLDILRRRQAGRMLISGVQRTVRPQELAAEHDVNRAIFDCCIDLGREAVDTRSNADEVAHWLRRRGRSPPTGTCRAPASRSRKGLRARSRSSPTPSCPTQAFASFSPNITSTY